MININKRVNQGDIYETPEELTNMILKFEEFQGKVFEPCCASGKMSKVLEEHGYVVISSDIRTENIYGEGGKDFFEFNDVADNIMTNPPYSIATDFVIHALQHCSKKVIMLLRIQFLNGVERKEVYENYPPKRVYVISKRPTLYPMGQAKPKNGGTIDYVWIVWEIGYIGATELKWI